MNSTVIRVPLMSGFPTMTAGSAATQLRHPISTTPERTVLNSELTPNSMVGYKQSQDMMTRLAFEVVNSDWCGNITQIGPIGLLPALSNDLTHAPVTAVKSK